MLNGCLRAMDPWWGHTAVGTEAFGIALAREMWVGLKCVVVLLMESECMILRGGLAIL